MNYEEIIAQKDAAIAQKDVEIQQQVVPATVRIVDDGNDGVSNIQVFIFDNTNVLQETVIWPTNPDGPVYTGWKVEI